MPSVRNAGKKEELYTSSKTARVSYDSTTIVDVTILLTNIILCTIDVLASNTYWRIHQREVYARHVIKEDNPISTKREAHAIHVPQEKKLPSGEEGWIARLLKVFCFGHPAMHHNYFFRRDISKQNYTTSVVSFAFLVIRRVLRNAFESGYTQIPR